MRESSGVQRVDTVVVGGGQAGLAMGYHLSRLGVEFVILDASARVGDPWRARWDSLRLFTPARFDGLPGSPFPAPAHYFPTKDEQADYLGEYAVRNRLPVQSGVRVERLTREGSGYRLSTTAGVYEAGNVVVAMSNYQQAWTPPFARELDPGIVQLHSADYRNPGQLRPGGVLLVGAGNSAAEIARELASHHDVVMSGRNTGKLPFRVEGLPGRLLFVPLTLRVVFLRVLSIDTPAGRALRPKMTGRGGPLIRVKNRDLRTAGVRRVERTVGVRDGVPVLADGSEAEVTNVVWCTGYRPGFEEWIDLPVHGAHEPRHVGGFVPDFPGLYFLGLHFLRTGASGMIHGVGADAERIARSIAQRPTPNRLRSAPGALTAAVRP
jgi:putative flavoprotein involved in K+ transport